jgi:hypothetical protein
VRFVPTIPASERAKTVHALDRAATVTGSEREKTVHALDRVATVTGEWTVLSEIKKWNAKYLRKLENHTNALAVNLKIRKPH